MELRVYGGGYFTPGKAIPILNEKEAVWQHNRTERIKDQTTHLSLLRSEERRPKTGKMPLNLQSLLLK
jgi:hypothetical protein